MNFVTASVIGDVYLGYLVKVMSARFLHGKVIAFPSVVNILEERFWHYANNPFAPQIFVINFGILLASNY